MKYAVLSGKGGTGKTFVSVNLASSIENSIYLDCDVEEPNGELFFRPEITDKIPVNVLVPEFDKEKCTGCKDCVDFCAFNALAFIKNKPILFPEVCHSCGGCVVVCKHGAVKEKDKLVGEVVIGKSGYNKFVSGKMEIGEASGIPIIEEILKNIDNNVDSVIDCPPGSGCMAMEAIKGADYCILVAEPTEFGRHNLEMVYDLVNVFDKPFGVVLNKCLEDTNPSEEFCKEKNIEIISKIPFDNIMGEQNSKGEIVYDINNNAKDLFNELRDRLKKDMLIKKYEV